MAYLTCKVHTTQLRNRVSFMHWEDTGFIIQRQRHGEHGLIVSALTCEHGVHRGMVRSLRKSGAICQPGNQVALHWSARLEEHLGHFSCESEAAYTAHIFSSPPKLLALEALCDTLYRTLPEREPQQDIFYAFQHFIRHMTDPLSSLQEWMADYVKIELLLLTTLGYGLDLSCCAATGETESLCYVSPKSGRAVSAEAGAPYHDKLLPLPCFLTQPEHTPDKSEIIDGIRLTSYFLEKYIFSLQHAKMPSSRVRFAREVIEKDICALP